MKKEKVLCIPQRLLDEIGCFQGMSHDAMTLWPKILSSPDLQYIERTSAESDPTFKQLIPYVLVVCGEKILRYERNKSGGEERLHGLYSLGVGGHLCEEDSGPVHGYMVGLRRELEEELGIPSDSDMTIKVVGAVNDDSNEVGKVHIGIIHLLSVNDTDLKYCEDLREPKFIALEEVMSGDLDEYEGWSRHCISKLPDLLQTKNST